LFKFSTVSMEWTKLDAAAGVEDGHEMSAVGTDLYLFGGNSAELFNFSTVSRKWTKLDAAAGVEGTGPSVRFGHAISAVGTDLYLFGGYSMGAGTGVSSYCVTVYRGRTVTALYGVSKACIRAGYSSR
jgi:hypothetical protein